MSEFIPPASATVGSTTDLSGSTLATQWVRLGAQLIDGLITGIPAFVILWIIGTSSGTLNHIMMVIIVYGLLLAINWNLLESGQTVGKKFLGIKIVRKDGSEAGRHHLLTKRIAPVGIAAAVPFIGGLALLIDALCIFRPGFNTLHDEYADTKVIVTK